jgi:(2Fe-2S) ferredoxin
MPHRERYFFVCTNRRDPGNPKGSCAEKGSEELHAKLKAKLVEKGAIKRLRACTTSCLDLCEIGASIVVEPDHVAYGRVTLGDIDEIVDAALEGRVVERLVVHGGSKP